MYLNTEAPASWIKKTSEFYNWPSSLLYYSPSLASTLLRSSHQACLIGSVLAWNTNFSCFSFGYQSSNCRPSGKSSRSCTLQSWKNDTYNWFTVKAVQDVPLLPDYIPQHIFTVRKRTYCTLPRYIFPFVY